MTTIRGKWGEWEITGYKRSGPGWRQYWLRQELYYPHDGRDPIPEQTWAASADDATRPFISYSGDPNNPADPYCADCSWCYLGASHTVAEHNKRAKPEHQVQID